MYNCFCNCDGSWECPPSKTKDVCNSASTSDSGCSTCTVDGRRIDGNTRFQHRNGCIEYECVCNCDGSWDCPGENAKDVCNTDPNSGCYYCSVGGERYVGNDYFTYVNGCIEYNCICNCDGSWDCPGERAKDLCKLNQTSGCTYCEIDGYLYQGQSNFDLVQDCYSYKGCTCKCDGGWTCAHTRGEYICDFSGNEKTDCQTCNIEGTEFRADSMFFYNKGCVRYICTCGCDGRFHCPASNARVTCPGATSASVSTLSSRSGSYSYSNSLNIDTGSSRGSRNCIDCVVNRQSYKASETFTLRSGCNQFMCTCYCNGTHICPPEKTLNKCLSPSDADVSAAQGGSSGGSGGIGGSSRYRSGSSGSSSSYSSSSSSGGSGSYTERRSSGGGGIDASSGSESYGSTRQSGSGAANTRVITGISRFDEDVDYDGVTGVNVCRNCTYEGMTFEGKR